MKKIALYNTWSRSLEEFAPLKKGRLSFYYCGPTVYWNQHIGNLRGAFCADLVRRVFSYNGYKVKMVRNFTDVGHLSSDDDQGEDKMALGAAREGLSPLEIATKYIDSYLSDTEKLNIEEPEVMPRATEHIKDSIALVKTLLDKGYAYSTKLAIYFSVAKFPEYGHLANRDLDKNRACAGRGQVLDEEKKDPADFALWFFKAGDHKKALQFWPSPFYSPLVKDGEGFPGWHIECSAMAKRYLGETIDIHMGGIEHISVHHSNEIAQSEAANQVKFVNYWLHNAHLLVDNKKMAKSAGTSYLLDDIIAKGFSPLALRYFFLQAHYRSNQNFTWQALQAAASGLDKLYSRLSELGVKKGKVSKVWQDKFFLAINNDFNAPASLALASDIFKSKLSSADKLATLLHFDKVWGLGFKERFEKRPASISKDAKKLLKDRDQARLEKDFKRADKLRLELEKLGYIVVDGTSGSQLKKQDEK